MTAYEIQDGTLREVADPPTRTDLVHVVRCRDCVKWHMCDVNEDGSMRGSCDEWTHLDGFTHATREDGFCAWGERRDA